MRKSNFKSRWWYLIVVLWCGGETSDSPKLLITWPNKKNLSPLCVCLFSRERPSLEAAIATRSGRKRNGIWQKKFNLPQKSEIYCIDNKNIRNKMLLNSTRQLLSMIYTVGNIHDKNRPGISRNCSKIFQIKNPSILRVFIILIRNISERSLSDVSSANSHLYHLYAKTTQNFSQVSTDSNHFNFMWFEEEMQIGFFISWWVFVSHLTKSFSSCFWIGKY